MSKSNYYKDLSDIYNISIPDWYGITTGALTPKYCSHNWKPVLLLTSTVYDCEHCGMKKEAWDKQQKESTDTMLDNKDWSF